ncbi:hypothetical protein KH5H1_60960 [Corallococcus caeni]|uniref:hypothetical protein n=1 Tax=Corallococcus caeni TaxID=3082388 RepID=UPI00295820E2|nr:hypothetical protein KH5H1_60960 [Corallococcus sp. KH5-1]
MARTSHIVLRSGGAGAPPGLRLILRLGLTSDELLPVLQLAERAPEQLRVGLTEHLSRGEHCLLGASAAGPGLAMGLLASGAPMPALLAAGMLSVVSGLAFLALWPWRLRAIVVRRARAAPGFPLSLSLNPSTKLPHPVTPSHVLLASRPGKNPRRR